MTKTNDADPFSSVIKDREEKRVRESVVVVVGYDCHFQSEGKTIFHSLSLYVQQRERRAHAHSLVLYGIGTYTFVYLQCVFVRVRDPGHGLCE